MKKAYCSFDGFAENAKQIIEEAGIQLTTNKSKSKPNGEELISILKDYDILIIDVFCKLTADMVKHVKNKKIIATISVGLNHIDKSFFDSPLITVVNIKTANAISVAEHIFSLILSLNKRLFESNQLVIEKKGHRNNVHERPDDISEKTLGLIGCGNITTEVIKIANIFNMKIKCYTKNPEKHQNVIDKGVEFVSLNEVLQESDIINISIPLNNETKNLISKDKINLMKPTATFINTSRAEIVDIRALIEYSDLNSTFYVGLDIDLDEYKELFSEYRSNVIVTPHTAGISKQAIYRMDVEIANKVVYSLEKLQD